MLWNSSVNRYFQADDETRSKISDLIPTSRDRDFGSWETLYHDLYAEGCKNYVPLLVLLHSPIRQHLCSVHLEITWFYNNLRTPIWTMVQLQDPFINSDQELFMHGSKVWLWYADLHDSQRSNGHSYEQVDFFYLIFTGMILFLVVYFVPEYKSCNCPVHGEITLFAAVKISEHLEWFVMYLWS